MSPGPLRRAEESPVSLDLTGFDFLNSLRGGIVSGLGIGKPGRTIMTRRFLLLAVAAVFWSGVFAGSASAKLYRVGGKSCDFEDIEKLYKDDPEAFKMSYNQCRVLKGQATGDVALKNLGLSRLRELAEHQNDIRASFFWEVIL